MSLLVETPMVLDRMLPEHQFSKVETLVVEATPDLAFRAALDLDLLTVHTPVFDALMWARGLPDRVRRHAPRPPASMRLADLFADGGGDSPFFPLGQEQDHELAVGAIGKPWKPSVEWRRTTPEEFEEFDEPGWAKIAFNNSFRPYGGERTLASYDARVWCTDEASAHRFRRYWLVAAPGIRVVMRATLRSIKEAAERPVLATN